MHCHRDALHATVQLGQIAQLKDAIGGRCFSLHPVLDKWYDQHMVGSVNSMHTERAMSLVRQRAGPNTSQITEDTLLQRCRSKTCTDFVPVQGVNSEQWAHARQRHSTAVSARAAGGAECKVHAAAFMHKLEQAGMVREVRGRAATLRQATTLIKSLGPQFRKKMLLAACNDVTMDEVRKHWPTAALVQAELMKQPLPRLQALVPLVMEGAPAPPRPQSRKRQADTTVSNEEGSRQDNNSNSESSSSSSSSSNSEEVVAATGGATARAHRATKRAQHGMQQQPDPPVDATKHQKGGRGRGRGRRGARRGGGGEAT